MDKVYLILVDNNEPYEDHRQIELGFVETEQEAKDICERFTQEASNDDDYIKKSSDACLKCEEKCNGQRTSCEVNKKIDAIKGKDIYKGCYEPGDGTYIYREIDKIN